jgi:hypothetical protein
VHVNLQSTVIDFGYAGTSTFIGGDIAVVPFSRRVLALLDGLRRRITKGRGKHEDYG